MFRCYEVSICNTVSKGSSSRDDRGAEGRGDLLRSVLGEMLGSELLEEALFAPASMISRSAYALAVQEVAAVVLSWELT